MFNAFSMSDQRSAFNIVLFCEVPDGQGKIMATLEVWALILPPSPLPLSQSRLAAGSCYYPVSKVSAISIQK